MPNKVDELRDVVEHMEIPLPNFGYHPSDEIAVLDLLLDAKSDLEARDDEGMTPLLLACRCGRPSRVARLLERGANVCVRNRAGQSVRDVVQSHHDAEQRDQILKLCSPTL